MMLTIGLSYIAFIMLRHITSVPSFLRAFIMMWYWILSRAFSASVEMIRWFVSLFPLMCYCTFIDLHMLIHSYIPGMKLTWTRWLMFMICYWIWFAIILLRIFASMFIKEIGLYISFLDVSLPSFGMSGILAS
jgi:hypothetical protein